MGKIMKKGVTITVGVENAAIIGNQSEVGDSTQRFGVVIGAKAKRVKLEGNRMERNLDGEIQKK